MIRMKKESMKKIKWIDFLRLVIFVLVSPIIGIIMFMGMVGTSMGMVFIYLKSIVERSSRK